MTAMKPLTWLSFYAFLPLRWIEFWLDIKHKGQESPWEFESLSVSDKVEFLVNLPFKWIFFLTIPNCDNPRFENWYMLSFFMCVVWMGLLCSGMVYLGSMIGCAWRVDPVIMGVIVLAAGTSVPDLVASVTVARNGQGSMAIANAIGSNVFDILLGLGFPWFLAALAFSNADGPVSVPVNKNGIVVSVIILFCTVVVFVCLLLLNKMKMNKCLSFSLIGLYVLYVIWALVENYLDSELQPIKSIGSRR
jgi:hypothetical protein